MTTDRDFDSTAYGRGYKDGKRDADAEITRLKAEVARVREAYREMARAALAVARPVIREECARLCEECSLHDEDGVDWNTDPRVTLAAAIRAME